MSTNTPKNEIETQTKAFWSVFSDWWPNEPSKEILEPALLNEEESNKIEKRSDQIQKTLFENYIDSRELRLISIQLFYLYTKSKTRPRDSKVFVELEKHFNQDIILITIFNYWFENGFQTTEINESQKIVKTTQTNFLKLFICTSKKV